MTNKKQNTATAKTLSFVPSESAHVVTASARKAFGSLVATLAKRHASQSESNKAIAKTLLRPIVESKGQEEGSTALVELFLLEKSYAVVRYRPEILAICHSVGLRTKDGLVTRFSMPEDANTWEHIEAKIDAYKSQKELEASVILSDEEIANQKAEKAKAQAIDLTSKKGKENLVLECKKMGKTFERKGCQSMAILMNVISEYPEDFIKFASDLVQDKNSKKLSATLKALKA